MKNSCSLNRSKNKVIENLFQKKLILNDEYELLFCDKSNWNKDSKDTEKFILLINKIIKYQNDSFIDLSYIHFPEIELNQFNIKNEIDFYGSKFYSNLSIEDMNFDYRVNIRSCLVLGDFTFRNTFFKGVVNLVFLWIKGKTYFENIMFKNEVWFDLSTFYKKITFNNVEFLEEVSFEDVRFYDELIWENTNHNIEKADWDGSYTIIDRYNYEREKEIHFLKNQNPYLKLGSTDRDKYIIYENQNEKPYLLADIEQYQDKKYLYNGVEIALFIYWCYKNKLLIEAVMKVISLFEEEILPLSSEKLIEIMKSTIGTKVTTDYFTEEGKEFAIGYLTVTNWAYNFFYDLRKLYPTDTNFPKKLETEEELNTILKLLDIRYEQFNSDESFNSNQSREALLELLEIPTT